MNVCPDVAAGIVQSQSVAAAMEAVDRALFVTRAADAYNDSPQVGMRGREKQGREGDQGALDIWWPKAHMLFRTYGAHTEVCRTGSICMVLHG
jgi:hypothetical protein